MWCKIKTSRSRWTPIGVDLGVSGVRLAQGRWDGNRLAITAVAHAERPLGATEPEADPEVRRRRLTDCCSKDRFRGRWAVATLSSPDLAYHALELPPAALDAGAEELVRIEVERLASRSAGEFETRSWRLPGSASSGPNTIAVEAAAPAVLDAVETCAEGRMDCLCVEPSATALVRFATLLRPQDEMTISGILDLGERSSRLIIFAGETPLLVRTTGTGARSWTQRISDALQVTFRNAEVHKRSCGICRVGPGRDDGAGDRSELPAMLLGAVRLDLTELAGEVKRSFEYVLGCHPKCRAGDLLLVGGGSLMRNLPEFLSQVLGIDVVPASAHLRNPETRLFFPPAMREPVEVFALAVGLAAGG